MGRANGDSAGTRAAIYARISDDKRGDEAGVNRQREDCIALISREGWQSVGEYIDNDISAFSGRVRPAYRKLCEDIKAGAIDVVIAWHPDRLHRSPRELEDWIDLTDAGGVVVHTVRADGGT
jgi:DNA invertase Pin-like site-specific DNA recombinase